MLIETWTDENARRLETDCLAVANAFDHQKLEVYQKSPWRTGK
jgi:hypothetical protein